MATKFILSTSVCVHWCMNERVKGDWFLTVKCFGPDKDRKALYKLSSTTMGPFPFVFSRFKKKIILSCLSGTFLSCYHP